MPWQKPVGRVLKELGGGQARIRVELDVDVGCKLPRAWQEVGATAVQCAGGGESDDSSGDKDEPRHANRPRSETPALEGWVERMRAENTLPEGYFPAPDWVPVKERRIPRKKAAPAKKGPKATIIHEKENPKHCPAKKFNLRQRSSQNSSRPIKT